MEKGERKRESKRKKESSRKGKGGRLLEGKVNMAVILIQEGKKCG